MYFSSNSVGSGTIIVLSPVLTNIYDNYLNSVRKNRHKILKRSDDYDSENMIQ
jgi:hypothetical protein